MFVGNSAFPRSVHVNENIFFLLRLIPNAKAQANRIKTKTQRVHLYLSPRLNNSKSDSVGAKFFIIYYIKMI